MSIYVFDWFFRDHDKRLKSRRIDDEQEGGTAPEEVVSFIDLPPNNLTKLPEKGILKKHGGYGIVMPDSCNNKWAWLTHDIPWRVAEGSSNVGESKDQGKS